MPITTVVLNSTDVTRSVAFYTTHLELVGESDDQGATLDAQTASVHVRPVAAPAEENTWIPDNHQKGFRHLGFKVTDVDERAERMKTAGVPFLFEPLDIGDLRVCFFYDPDGTLLEMVQGDIHYTEVLDAHAVAAERSFHAPKRPRFDHIALTVADRDRTHEYYRDRFGFSLIGIIDPPIDMDGFSIAYLKSGDTVLELFTFERNTTDYEPQRGHPGFAYAELSKTQRDRPPLARQGSADVCVDSDGFAFATARTSTR